MDPWDKMMRRVERTERNEMKWKTHGNTTIQQENTMPFQLHKYPVSHMITTTATTTTIDIFFVFVII